MLPLDEFDYDSTKLIRIQVGQRFLRLKPTSNYIERMAVCLLEGGSLGETFLLNCLVVRWLKKIQPGQRWNAWERYWSKVNHQPKPLKLENLGMMGCKNWMKPNTIGRCWDVGESELAETRSVSQMLFFCWMSTIYASNDRFLGNQPFETWWMCCWYHKVRTFKFFRIKSRVAVITTSGWSHQSSDAKDSTHQQLHTNFVVQILKGCLWL